MTAFDWMFLPYRRYADFQGRSCRKEFWYFTLFYFLVSTLSVLPFLISVFYLLVDTGRLSEAGGNDAVLGFMSQISVFGWAGLIFFALFALASFIPSLAVTVRRFHDKGLSGWIYAGIFVVSIFVGIVGWATYIIAALPGEKGPNEYGPDPLAPFDEDVFA